jgi:hypothetical protein
MRHAGLQRPRTIATAAVVALLAVTSLGCGLFGRRAETTPPAADNPPPPLPVQKAPEDVIVAAWAEPSRLPPTGGQTQILVRLQKRGGIPFPGVEVRLQTSAGSLFSGGRVLVTDASGRTRDRLTTRSSAHVTLNAGGTVYRFRVPVAAIPAS